MDEQEIRQLIQRTIDEERERERRANQYLNMVMRRSTVQRATKEETDTYRKLEQ